MCIGKSLGLAAVGEEVAKGEGGFEGGWFGGIKRAGAGEAERGIDGEPCGPEYALEGFDGGACLGDAERPGGCACADDAEAGSALQRFGQGCARGVDEGIHEPVEESFECAGH